MQGRRRTVVCKERGKFMGRIHFANRLGRVACTWCLALITVAYALPVRGQQTLGNVRGVIKDDTGALVSGATVTILDKTTNNKLTTQSTPAGEFEFKNLPVGGYVVS